MLTPKLSKSYSERCRLTIVVSWLVLHAATWRQTQGAASVIVQQLLDIDKTWFKNYKNRSTAWIPHRFMFDLICCCFRSESPTAQNQDGRGP